MKKIFITFMISVVFQAIIMAQPQKGNVEIDAPTKGGTVVTSQPRTVEPNPRTQEQAPIAPSPKNTGVISEGETKGATKGDVLAPAPKPRTVENTPAPAVNPKNNPLPEIDPKEVGQVIVKGNEGQVTNWTEGYIEATGRCFIDRQKFPLPGQAEELCKNGAEALARRNLLAQIQQVRIIDTITLVNQVFERQTTKQILDGYIRNAYKVGGFTVTESYVEVTMRMNLRDGQNSVASAATQAIQQSVAAGRLSVPQSNVGSEVQNQLLQAMTAEGLNTSNPLVMNIQQSSGVKPSLFPTLKFVTEDGKEIPISTAPLLSNINGAQQVMPYVQLAENVLKNLNIKGYSVLDGMMNPDGSVTIQLKNQPKAAKFLKVLKQVGVQALQFLPLVMSLF